MKVLEGFVLFTDEGYCPEQDDDDDIKVVVSLIGDGSIELTLIDDDLSRSFEPYSVLCDILGSDNVGSDCGSVAVTKCHKYTIVDAIVVKDAVSVCIENIIRNVGSPISTDHFSF